MSEKEVRLIDANALLEQVENEIHRYWNEGGGGYYLAEDALSDIKNAPTIDPESLRPKGRNLKAQWSSLFDCSVCGWVCWDTETCYTNSFNYCPNCGAKMEE